MAPVEVTTQDGTEEESKFHAFHSWQHHPPPPSVQAARRQVLWSQHHQPGLSPTQHSVTRRSVPGEGISINLGVKRITIEDSVLDMLEHRSSLEIEEVQKPEKWSSQVDVMVTSSNLAVAFSIFLILFFVILSLLFSMFFNNKRYIVRKL